MIGNRHVLAIWAETQLKDGTYVMGRSATNDLPWPPFPPDMRHFRRKTLGRVLVMGRRTFESLPMAMKSANALQQRPMLVLTRDPLGFARSTKYLEARAHDLIQPIRIGPSFIMPTNDFPIARRNVRPLNAGAGDWTLTEALQWPQFDRDIAVIGGPKVINDFAPVIDTCEVTEMDAGYSAELGLPFFFDGDVPAPDPALFLQRKIVKTLQYTDDRQPNVHATVFTYGPEGA